MTKVFYIISDITKSLSFEWIALNLDKQNFDLSFVLLNSGSSELEDFLKKERIPVYRFDTSSKKKWPIAFIKLFFLFLSHKPEVIHCHLYTANILGLMAGKLANIKSRIYTRHHSDYHFRYFPKGVKWDKLCNKLATKIIAPSKVVAGVLINKEDVPANKVVLVHHGFDISYFQYPDIKIVDKLRKKYNPQNKYPVIGVISRFTELKGIQYIIPAFEQLLEIYPNALLLLFNANGDYKNVLLKQLSDLPESSYHCVSFESELSSVYALFDIFIQVSTDSEIEAFGQTYVEALAAEVPSVFTLAGVAGEFIKHNINAYVVDFKSSSDIYVGILQLLKDSDFTTELQKNGLNDVNKIFSIKKMVKELENIYLPKLSD